MSQPNTDNADSGSMAGILKSWLRSFIRENLDDMLPAKVVSYDDVTNRAVVKPLVMVKTTDGQKVSRTQIPNIKVFRFGGGGFFIRFPIKAGDFGWLKANDRDISLVFQRGGLEDWPNTDRLHSFSDAMFFPDTLKDWAIDGANSDALVIQSMDGSVCVALHDGKITMKAPEMEVNIPNTTWTGNITLNGNQTIDGDLTVSGMTTLNGLAVGNVGIPSTINFRGNINHTGNYQLAGNFVHTSGNMTSMGRNVGSTHTHPYTEGDANTGAPNV